MTDSTPTLQTGWYPDPSDSSLLRYWSGTQWSAEVHPAPPPPGQFVRPWWQQWWAIILTLLVFFPLGLVGIWQRKGTSVGVKIAISVAALALFSWYLVTRLQS